MPDEPELQSERPDTREDDPASHAASEQPPGDGQDGPGEVADAGGLASEADTQADVESSEGFEEELARRSLTVMDRNRLMLGQLILHYPSRDVTVYLDGEAALRVLKMFEQRRQGGLADELDPGLSSAGAGWLVLDIEGGDVPLAMSWMPGLPTKRPRTTVDPAVAA